MGPLELQLYRELAVEVVRACVNYLRSTERYDLERQRAWFDQLYADWASTPRPELDGRTPADVIREERAQLGLTDETWPALARQMEFYTDLPQPQPEVEVEIEVEEMIGDEQALVELAGALAAAELLEQEPPLSPSEQARWESFRDRHLRGWLDDHLPG